MDHHELVVAVKDLALELGRSPTRSEFEMRTKGAARSLGKIGGYSALLLAAGLDTYSDRRGKKITNQELFGRDLEETLLAYKPIEAIPQPVYTPTLAIGDTHFPFASQKTLEFIYRFAEKHKPKRIVQVGDLYDMYAHSKFPRSLNVYTPQQEEDLGRRGAEEMWKILQGIVPQAECVQLKGNHDVRPVKRTAESSPSMEHWAERILNELMSFPGVTLIKDSRQEYISEGVAWLHGYRSKLGDHMYHMMMNAVCGHIHRGGTVFRRFRGQTFWELNAGFCAEPESKALGYTPQKIHDYTLGLGWIDEEGPRFVPKV